MGDQLSINPNENKKTNRIKRRCAIPSTAGPIKSRKSEEVIQEGMASTPNVTPASSSRGNVSVTDSASSSGGGLFSASRKI
jgi:hypothetical protein